MTGARPFLIALAAQASEHGLDRGSGWHDDRTIVSVAIEGLEARA